MSHHHHIESPVLYFKIFFTLIALTALTAFVAYLDFGAFNLPIALSIAVLKATLVMLFFMNVRHANRLTQLTSVIAFFWLILLIMTTLSDYGSRKWPLSNNQSTWITEEPAVAVRK